jgi:hypothetical protein
MTQKRLLTEVMQDGRIFLGYNALVWVCRETGDVVVTGDPRIVEAPGCSEDEGHNCDAAGCGQSHVLARGKVVGVA